MVKLMVTAFLQNFSGYDNNLIKNILISHFQYPNDGIQTDSFSMIKFNLEQNQEYCRHIMVITDFLQISLAFID